MKNYLKKLAWFVSILALFVQPVSVWAQPSLDQCNKDHIYNDTVWYDPCSASTASCTTDTAPPTAAQTGPLYFVGDSIGARISSELTKDLSSKGWHPKINALSSRNLSGTPPSPDGLGAVNQDQDYIKAAEAIVVELGTNTNGFTTSNVNQMIDTLKGLAPNAAIYWVDTAVVDRPSYVSGLNNVNSIIYSQSSAKGYSVISWNKAVFGDSADPQNIDPNAKDTNGYIDNSDGLGVHPNAKGITALSNLITSAVSGNGSGTTNAPAGCASACSSTSLQGNDNIEKAFNYFVSKGLTPAQSAGIVGNLMWESSVDPQKLQGGGDSQNPNDAGSGGYGIAQWTPGSKLLTIAAGLKITDPIYELSTQLDVLWGDISGDGVASGLKQISGNDHNAAAAAATYFMNNYERPASATAHLDDRIKNAQEVLDQYGNNTGGATPPSGSGCSSLSPDCKSASGVAKILCDAKIYDPVSYQESGIGGHQGGAAWHASCPNIGPSCYLDCSGLVNIAVYDVYGVDLRETTYTEATDAKNWEHIGFDQLQPGDLIQPGFSLDSSGHGHVEIVDHIQGNTIYTFGAHTSHVPQPDQVSPASMTKDPNDLYLHYIGQGSGT